MSREALFEALRDLGWSLFTELGVPGVVRHHQQVVIDPEPIVVAAPALFRLDPRFRDQVYGWCSTHARRLSVSRLQGLSRKLPEPARAEFHRLAATLRTHGGVRWPAGDAAPWSRPPEVRARRLPLERPALLRFRVRALCGVGARADVLCALGSRLGTWTRASELVGLGYSKRAVAGILSELAEAGLAQQLAVGNALTYQLACPEALGELVGGQELVFPDWWSIVSLVLAALDLAELQEARPATRRVEAHRRRKGLSQLSAQVGLAPPPVTRGDPAAWESLMSWARTVAEALARGDSPALGVPGVRVVAVERGR